MIVRCMVSSLGRSGLLNSDDMNVGLVPLLVKMHRPLPSTFGACCVCGTDLGCKNIGCTNLKAPFQSCFMMVADLALSWQDAELCGRLREVHDLLLAERWEAGGNCRMRGLHPNPIHIVWVGGKLVQLGKLSCRRVSVLLHCPLCNGIC